jgi:hypothetical protein
MLIMVLWESEDHRRTAFDIGDIDFPQFRRITDLPQSLDILHYRYHATRTFLLATPKRNLFPAPWNPQCP